MSGRPRICVDPGDVRGGRLFLGEEHLRHLQRVLRLREGDLFAATDGKGLEMKVRLVSAGDRPEGEIVESGRPRRESSLKLILAQGLPKGEEFEQVLRRAVELGVTEVHPLVTSRTVRKASGTGHSERWRKIVAGAVAQSGRTFAPVLARVRTFGEYLDGDIGAEVKIILWEKSTTGLQSLLGAAGAPASVALAVGPEGGWRPDEVKTASERGFQDAGMGPRLLRSGTAGVAALGVIQYACGDLGFPAAEGEGDGRSE